MLGLEIYQTVISTQLLIYLKKDPYLIKFLAKNLIKDNFKKAFLKISLIAELLV